MPHQSEKIAEITLKHKSNMAGYFSIFAVAHIMWTWLYPVDDEHCWSVETKEVKVNDALSILPVLKSATTGGHQQQDVTTVIK